MANGTFFRNTISLFCCLSSSCSHFSELLEFCRP
jgi:hypothetical protein